MVRLRHERDLETLRQISLLLDNENKRLIERNRKLTLELARALGLDDRQREQMELSLLQELEKTRETIFGCDERQEEPADSGDKKKEKKRKGHGPRPQRQLPLVELPAFELAEENKGCKVCGGVLQEMKGQFEESEWVTVVHREFRRERIRQQKYRCS